VEVASIYYLKKTLSFGLKFAARVFFRDPSLKTFKSSWTNWFCKIPKISSISYYQPKNPQTLIIVAWGAREI